MTNMQKRIGIDAGGSLVKIVIEEKGKLTYKKYPIEKLDDAVGWLAILAQQAEVNVTGGKAEYLRKRYFPNAKVVTEFDASCEGARYLIKKSRLKIASKFMLVNIGTGTSWYLIEAEKTERILGSGIGGGTFMGLGKLLSTRTEYSQLVEQAIEGDKANIDLLVKDIYHPEDPPIEGTLTASNFAKAAETVAHSESDRIAAIVNMIAETIVLLSNQTAKLHQTQEIVYIGSTLIENSTLQAGLERFSSMVGLTPHFLQDGEYCGAIGALIV
ncbi:type II pantothenate kinase [Mesobacillus maritimus]|uniref:type II pantothenate kinase n=1 Tax=Mesobacillus maritimus TaxID=1643336 RepID=UPI00384A7A6D